MSREIKAVYSNGEIKPLERLDLPEESRLTIIIEQPNGEGQRATDSTGDPLATVYEIAEDIGPADLATNLDHYLYGTPKVE